MKTKQCLHEQKLNYYEQNNTPMDETQLLALKIIEIRQRITEHNYLKYKLAQAGSAKNSTVERYQLFVANGLCKRIFKLVELAVNTDL
ncbi:hypothetical protein J6590_046279 [Homalodisca vitripennis]|nr:hypothetical protein J6590_046279 [Homalodisca vitripennis]